MKGFKFVATQVLVLKKIEREDKIKYGTFYSHSKETIINKSDMNDVLREIIAGMNYIKLP